MLGVGLQGIWCRKHINDAKLGGQPHNAVDEIGDDKSSPSLYPSPPLAWDAPAADRKVCVGLI